MLTAGTKAPDFTLNSTQGEFSLSALQGQKCAVVIFYPADNTPG